MKIAPLLVAAFALVACSAAHAQVPSPSDNLAKDTHQGFTVSADPYTDADRAKKEFGKAADPYKAGILAVQAFFKNNLNVPVHVDLSTIRLDVKNPNGEHSSLSPLTAPQAAARIAHPRGPATPKARHFPGLPGGNLPGKDSKTQDIEDKLTPLSLQSDVVPPNGTLHGMIFFDIDGQFDLVAHSSLYVPDVKSVASENPMIYFEVPLGPQH